MLMELSDEDKELITDYFLDCTNHGSGTEQTVNTKKGYVNALVYLSRHVKNVRNGGTVYKSFKDMTKDDFYAKEEPKGYLRSLEKSFEEEPLEKWVNTHNIRREAYLDVWKWWTQKDIPSEERQIPPQLKGVRKAKYKSKRKSRRKREDLWEPQHHVVFLRYCEDLRIACFHAILTEIGGRPGELLQLRLDDIEYVPSSGKQVCEFWIGDKVGGKMKWPRQVSISDAIPFFNTWSQVHPARDYKEKEKKQQYLFISLENSAKYQNKPLEEDSLRDRYKFIIEKQFPKKLEDPTVPLEDKAALRTRIYDKPHYPYIRRHEWHTEDAFKLSSASFKQLGGNSPNSKVDLIYQHEFGNEALREFEILRGIRT